MDLDPFRKQSRGMCEVGVKDNAKGFDLTGRMELSFTDMYGIYLYTCICFYMVEI